MATFIERAKSLHVEALKALEESKKSRSKAALSEGCRKCWLVCTHAADALLQCRNISLPRDDKERRACLELLESMDPKVRDKEIADRVSVR